MYRYELKIILSNDEKEIIKLMFLGKENIDIMKIYGYMKITDNSKLYSSILKCRKIIKICSTTREQELLNEKLNS